MKTLSRLTLAASTALLVLAAGMVVPAIAHAETVRGVECTIVGTDGDDVLRGTPEDDVICGLEGDDVLIGLDGDDLLVGGPGDDELRGGRGDDGLVGGPGEDELKGGPGADHLTAGGPNDGPIAEILPVFKLPTGTRVQFLPHPSSVGTCYERAAASWGYEVGDPVEFHFLIEGSTKPECVGKPTTNKWRVRVTTPNGEISYADVALAAKFASKAAPIPEGTTVCTSEEITCAGVTTAQKFWPMLPLYVTVTIGPK